ncbi:hypothetical protein RU98_GL000127 [Enterococcus caccae]|nr:hypothetical protein RU98_GL000127 [Enterococcus caccae]
MLRTNLAIRVFCFTLHFISLLCFKTIFPLSKATFHLRY